MTVEVVVPWRDGCEHRRRALDWTTRRWAERHPDWTVTLAELAWGPWVKALAVMPAIVESSADVIVVADADVACDEVTSAVQAVLDGAAWAIPHGKVHRLTSAATAEVYGGADPADLGWEALAEDPYWGVAAGGLVVLTRPLALEIPLDPRFTGWGGEDHSWGFALSTLAGDPERGEAPLWHLWHPPAERVTRVIGSHASEALRRRYRDARIQADDMRRVVAEVPTPWLVARSPESR